MSVDILSIGNKNRKAVNQETSILNQGIQNVPQVSPKTKAQETLDRQVEVGLGSKIDNIMTTKDKKLYADSLSDKQWNLMQRYKAEGYSFEASKLLTENQKKLADPYAQGTNKYKDYQFKEQYYNNTNGATVDPDSNLYKVGSFLQKIGFNETYGNPLNKLATEYNEWYANEREAIDTLMEDQEANLLEKFGWWLQRSLMTAESGIITGLAKVGNAVQGIEDIKQSAATAALDNAILGLDTDANFYRQEDRRLDEYIWEGASGGLNTIFWAWAPKMMTAFSAIGETKPGATVLEKADGLVRGIIDRGLENGTLGYYEGLDEQGKEDMLDTMTTLAYMELAKRTKNATAKLKTTKVGIEYDALKNQFRTAMNEATKGAKAQAKAEVKNVKNATDIYGENGTKIGKMGPEGQVGVGKSVGRVVQAGVDSFKQSFIDRMNARHGGTIVQEGSVEAPTWEAAPTEDVVKPTESKGVVDRAKDIRDTKITGLTPEERIRVQNDPYVGEKFNTAMAMVNEAGMPLEDAFITEQLYNQIGDKIIDTFKEREAKLDESSPYYQQLRQLKTKYNLIEAQPAVDKLLADNDITISGDGTLNFTNSKFVSEADMRSVQRAVDMIARDIITPLTPRKYLNLRKKLDQLASYATVDASRGQSLIRQLRYAVDDVAKKQIPGLKDLDKVTKDKFKEIQELKEGWVYKGGDRKGEIRNNFYSIIKNLTGQNRKVMLERMKKYYPSIEEEIEAIHITEKLIKAYNKSPQIIKSLGIGGAIGGAGWVLGGASTGMVTAMLGAIVGELIQEDIIKPWTKKMRMNAINKLVSEMSPQAKAKLEEIARKQSYAKELSSEDQAILEKVAQVIVQERDRGLSEQAIREREKRTAKLEQEALPGVNPDVVGPDGTITLGRGNPISPDKGPGRPKKLGRINEINLRNAEVTPSKEALDIQEKLGVDEQTATEIQSTIDDFLSEIGADNAGSIAGRSVNYDKFSTKSLERLMDNDNLPKSEKDKIEELLLRRGAEEEIRSATEMDHEYAYEINKLQEEEQRIGKVGRNKVSKDYADKQKREWEKKREKLIKRMMEDYGIDQFQAEDKYLDLESKGTDYINEYKRSPRYKEETAEQEVLDRLLEGWSKQPKFVRDMNEGQLINRQEFLNNIDLKDGYKLETTDYNDRYVLEENGQVVDKGAIKYLEDGTIEVTAQTIEGLINSGLASTLPDNAIIKVAGETHTKGDLKLSKGEEKKRTPKDIVFPKGNLYDIAVEDPIEKFNGTLTREQKQEGVELYKFASRELSGKDIDTDNDIIAARGKFLVMNQKPGYTKALGLNQGQVNKTITSWWEQNGGASEGLKKFNSWINDGVDPKYRFTGISNLITYQNPWRGIDAINYLVKDVKGAENVDRETYKPWIDATIDSLLLLDSHFNHGQTSFRFSTQLEMNKYALELGVHGANGEFVGDILSIIAGQGRETIPHETGHEVDAVTGLELFGVDWVRKGGHSERYATSKAARAYLKYNPKWKKELAYKTPEAMDFHREMLKLLDDIKIPEWMKEDKTPDKDGKPMSEYRTAPEEVWARFHQANITLTREMNRNGKVPKNTYKSDHGDVYEIELYKRWAQLLQKHQQLADSGAFYDVEPINRSGISTINRLRDATQNSLFNNGELTNSDYGDFILGKYNEIHGRIQPIAQKNNYMVDSFINQLANTYSPNMNTWINKLAEVEINVSPKELVAIYNEIRDITNDPNGERILEGLKQPHLVALNELLGEMKKQPLNVPEELKALGQLKQQESLSPLEKYLANSKDIDLLFKTYDPDIVEWKRNIQRRMAGGEDITVNELYKIKNLLDEYIKDSPEEIQVNGTLDDIGLKFLIEKAKYRENNNGKLNTFDKEQIEKIGEETEQIIQNRVADADIRYDRGDVKDQDLRDIRADEFDDFKEQYIYQLGKTYNPDVEKWHNNLKKALKEITRGYEGFKGMTRFGNVVQTNGLNSLKAKIKELEGYSHDDILEAFEGTYTDLFMRGVEKAKKELDSKEIEKAVTNLVAIHNIEIESFEPLISNFKGRDPMPSIAVMDVNVPHEVFGDISLVFGRDTVDPKVDERNVLYGSDAWTPMFPQTKYVKQRDGIEGAEGKVEEFVKKVQKELPEDAESKTVPSERIEDSIVGRLPSVKGEEVLPGAMVDRMLDAINLLVKENKGVEMPLQERLTWSNYLYDLVESGIKSHQTIPASYFDKSSKSRENIGLMAEDIAEYLKNDPEADYIGGFYDEGPEGERRLLEDITRFIEDRRDDGTSVIIDKLAMEYGADEDVLTDIVEIYYPRDGDRPLTPENVLQAMKNQKTRRKTYPGTYEDMIEIEGTTLGDIEDVRRQNFAKVFHGDRTGDISDLKDRYEKLIDVLKEYIADPDMANEIPDQVIGAAIKDAYDPDVDQFIRNLEEEGQFDEIPRDIIQRIVDVVEQGKKIPIRFSESKPERIVDLAEEVQYILVPEGKKADAVNKIVKDTPLEGKVVTYKPDTYSAPRSKKLKELQKKYGNVFFSMGGVIMPITMLMLMEDQIKES